MRPYQDYSNTDLADFIEARGIIDDGIPDHIREALLRFLWRDQAFVPAERLSLFSQKSAPVFKATQNTAESGPVVRPDCAGADTALTSQDRQP